MLESKILQFLNAFHAIIHLIVSFTLLWSKTELSSKDHKSTSSSDKGKFYALFILSNKMQSAFIHLLSWLCRRFMILEGLDNFETTYVNVLSYLCSLGNTIELNCEKYVLWFCSAEIKSEAKNHGVIRSIIILSSFQQLQ